MRGSALNTYTQNSINIESPIKLVEMLFEGILKFTAQAKKSMLDDDIEKQVYWINRTIDIFSELISSLDYSGEQENLAEYLIENQEETSNNVVNAEK